MNADAIHPRNVSRAGEICRCGHPVDCHLAPDSGGWGHPRGRLTGGTCLGAGPVPRLPRDIYPCGCENPTAGGKR